MTVYWGCSRGRGRAPVICRWAASVVIICREQCFIISLHCLQSSDDESINEAKYQSAMAEADGESAAHSLPSVGPPQILQVLLWLPLLADGGG